LVEAKGIAEVVATTLVTQLPELGTLSNKEISALVGVALVACMRKLLTILNAMLKNDTPWDPEFAKNA